MFSYRIVCCFGFDCDDAIFGEDSVISAFTDVTVFESIVLESWAFWVFAYFAYNHFWPVVSRAKLATSWSYVCMIQELEVQF